MPVSVFAISSLGIWFGKFMMLFGADAQSLSVFSTKEVTLLVNHF